MLGSASNASGVGKEKGLSSGHTCAAWEASPQDAKGKNRENCAGSGHHSPHHNRKGRKNCADSEHHSPHHIRKGGRSVQAVDTTPRSEERRVGKGVFAKV